MPTRALGALLAAAAAVMFVISIATSAWWSGHPRVTDRTQTTKDVFIGLHGGEGCNTGGDGTCAPLRLGSAFTTAAYVELGAAGLATVFALLVAAAAWRVSDQRRRVAKLAIGAIVIATAGAAALLVIGPEIQSAQTVEAPIGWGMSVFAAGLVTTVIASVITMGIERAPVQIKAAPAPQPVSSVGPTTTGLPVPGALVPPLAPQLRALYEIPAPGAPLGWSPTSELDEGVTERDEGVTERDDRPPRFQPAPISKPPTLPPPMRAEAPLPRPPSVPPFAVPAIGRSVPPSPPLIPRAVANGVDPLGKTEPATSPQRRTSMPMPPRPAAKPNSTPTPSLLTSAVRPSPSPSRTPSTVTHSVPPMPKIDTPPPQPVRAGTEPDDRLETAMRETDVVTAVEVARAEPPVEAEPTGQSEPLGDDTLESTSLDREVPESLEGPTKPDPRPPLSTAPSSLPPPNAENIAGSGPSPACPQCEAPMAWVEEHLRFYCKSCRMYF
jgi:hypothetical protein